METGYSDTHVTGQQECLAWLKDYAAQQNEADRALLQQALALAEAHYPADAHTYAGEPLLPHTGGAAQMVAQLDLLPEAVAATILSGMSKQGGDWQLQVAEQCGQTVCSLVQGIDQVQKLTHFARVDGLATPEERAAQAETMRKMLLAMVSDIRVVLIKLALRTRTMQYLGGCPDSPEKRSIAKETLDIFAPLANRLGVWQLKWQLEDLGFRHQNPEEYRRIAHLLDEKRPERQHYIDHFLGILKAELAKYGIRDYDVAGRPKHIYSIYRKMVKKKLDFEGLYDIRAVRVLVNSVPECYTVLGIVHSLWQPIPGEFDDYIANPKGNADLAAAFQTELFNDTIYVLTPHGKVLSLPVGATPIDFAYALHSSLGDRCRGAKVDGQIVPLSTPLENGQRVEIIAAKEGEPSVNWLYEGWVKSNKAAAKIRAHIRRQNAESVREQGRLQLEKTLLKVQPKPNMQALAEKLGFKKTDELYTAVAHGEIMPRAVQKACGLLAEPPAAPVSTESIVKQSRIKETGGKGGILVDGESGLLTTLAKCCKPAPPDEIAGFVTRGRGISIHRIGCASFQKLAADAAEKVVPACWAGVPAGQVFAVDIEVSAQDRNGLLRDISEALARHKLNVTAVQTQSRNLQASLRFTLEVHQVDDLPHVLASLANGKGVTGVSRL